MNFSLLFVLSVIINTNNILCCDYNIQSETATCTSPQELLNLQASKNWRKLNIVNSGQPVVLDENHFKYVPEVEELQLFGLINIKEGGFNTLKKLIRLLIENNDITSIEPHGFGAPNLEILSIFYSGVKYLHQGAFRNLPRLIAVSIVGNHISTILPKVFENQIKHLALNDNKIQFIENGAFEDLKNLDTLQLRDNELTFFDTKILFGNSSTLTHLDLRRNHIKSLTKDTFDGLEKLRSLFLGGNGLETVGDSCFQGLKGIYKIDISNNSLRELPASLFPAEGLSTLTALFLHDNQLCFLHPEVFLRLPSVNYFSYGGNPWQCPCWENLNKWIVKNKIVRACHDEYTAGKRPVCIINEQSPMECVYDKDKLAEIPHIFSLETSRYPKLGECII